jgi:OOP family OmpA-OmpF porin
MKFKTFIAWGALASCMVSGAQAQAPVLKGSDVSEQALVEALTIEAPMSPEGKTRGFKPAQPVDSQGRALKPGPGKASLLITFPTDSAEITPETKATLDTLARAVQSDALAGFSFSVEGHADARGDPEHNMQLSRMRAEAVVTYLVSQQGILPQRLSPVGKGSNEPLNKTRIDAPENRRVTIVTIRG